MYSCAARTEWFCVMGGAIDWIGILPSLTEEAS